MNAADIQKGKDGRHADEAKLNLSSDETMSADSG